MNKEFVEKNKGTIYHELGHLVGYLISNSKNRTDLGDVEKLCLGNINRVVSKQNLYHKDDRETFDVFQVQIKNNTNNVDRTLAWFIEVILGCTFQSLLENKCFPKCFNNLGIGRTDFDNMNIIRKLSSFSWNFSDVFEMQQEIADIIIKFDIIKRIKPIVENLKIELLNNELEILEIKDDELTKLSDEIIKIIPLKMIDKYHNVIKKFKIKLTNSC